MLVVRQVSLHLGELVVVVQVAEATRVHHRRVVAATTSVARRYKADAMVATSAINGLAITAARVRWRTRAYTRRLVRSPTAWLHV